jgi:alanine-glyoxylate transaminase / serine-glyoxylate transaminase / serine-pyruvate transaminase
MENVFARHALLARAVHAAVEAWSREGAMRFYCRVPEARSVSVTTIEMTKGHDPEAIREVARERFQVAVAGALGPQTGKAFRIGHLGDLNAPMILGALAGVEAAMTVQGIPFGRDGVQQAVAAIARG